MTRGDQHFLTSKEASLMLGVDVPTLNIWEREGRIKCANRSDNSGMRGRKHKKYSHEEIERFLRDCKTAVNRAHISGAGMDVLYRNDEVDLPRAAKKIYQAHELMLDYAMLVLKTSYEAFASEVEHIADPVELKHLVKSQNVADLNMWSQMAVRGTEGMSRAVGLEYYTNVNAAARRLEREGYTIVDSDLADASVSVNTDDGNIEFDEDLM